jgi:hypothetical protein
MESTTGSGDTLAKCHICGIAITHTDYRYEWTPIKGLSFSRDLCDECGDAFNIQTAHITSKLITFCTHKLLQWEDSLRMKKQMEKRQLRIPGI